MVIEIDKVRHCMVNPRTIEFEVFSVHVEDYNTGYIEQFDNRVKLVLQDRYGVNIFQEECLIEEDDYDYSIEHALDLIERKIGVCIEW